jgi:hypothetical protein
MLGACADPATSPHVPSDTPQRTLNGAPTAAQADSLQLTYLCGTRFRVRSPIADSVVVRWQVYNTPDSGRVLVPGRAPGAPHAEALFTTQAVGTVRLFVGERLVQTKANGGVACGTGHVVGVQVGEGVTVVPAGPGTVVPGLQQRAQGDTVRYAFRAAPGYEALRVTLDGAAVADSGAFVAAEPHLLRATALPVVTLAPGDDALVASAAGLLTAADPVAAYQAHVDLVDRALRGASAAEAQRRMAAVQWTAWKWPRDTAALARLEAALNGHSFDRSPGRFDRPVAAPERSAATETGGGFRPPASPGFTAPFSTFAAPTRPDSLEPVTFVYVNGISTSLTRALRIMRRLSDFVESMPRFALHTAAGRLNVIEHYNHTKVETPGNTSIIDRFVNCHYSLWRVSWPSPEHRFRTAEECVSFLSPVPSASDVVESARQFLALRNAASTVAEPDARTLAERVRALKRSGQHVIVVAHSQGNMMALQAERVRQSEFEPEPGPDTTGLGVLSLASPTPTAWPVTPARFRNIGVRGDFIQEWFGNQPTIVTWKSEAARLALDLGDQVYGKDTPQALAWRAVNWLPIALELHSIDQAYFSQPDVEARMRTALSDIYDQMVVAHVAVDGRTSTSSDPSYRTVGERAALRARVFNRTWTAIQDRPFVWRSTDPTVASVDSAGTVRAHAPGTATIWGRSWADSVGVPWVVQAVPRYSMAGSWSGTWSGGDWRSGARSGSVTLTIGGVGTDVTATMTMTQTAWGTLQLAGLGNAGFSPDMRRVGFYGSFCGNPATCNVYQTYNLRFTMTDSVRASGDMSDGIGQYNFVLTRDTP